MPPKSNTKRTVLPTLRACLGFTGIIYVRPFCGGASHKYQKSIKTKEKHNFERVRPPITVMTPAAVTSTMVSISFFLEIPVTRSIWVGRRFLELVPACLGFSKKEIDRNTEIHFGGRFDRFGQISHIGFPFSGWFPLNQSANVNRDPKNTHTQTHLVGPLARLPTAS